MKINQITINETSAGATGSGSVATVSQPMSTQTRGQGVYGNTKAGSLFKGKKTKKPYANSLNEGRMGELDYDLKNMKPADFKKKYGKSREEVLASFRKPGQTQPQKPVSEAELQEDDIVIVPGQGMKRKSGFVAKGQSRVDHEVEMARSDLYQAMKNAKKVFSMIKDRSEDEGLEGWVQEKIIKAADYLNTIREYLEGKEVETESHNGGVIAGGISAESTINESAYYDGYSDGFNGKEHPQARGKYGPSIDEYYRGYKAGEEKARQEQAARTQEYEISIKPFLDMPSNELVNTLKKVEDRLKEIREISNKERGMSYHDYFPKHGPDHEKLTAEFQKLTKMRQAIHNVIGMRARKGMTESQLSEKAVSKAQQKFMGMVHAAQKGEKPASKEVAKVAKTMKKSDAKDFAKTKHKGLPEKVKK